MKLINFMAFVDGKDVLMYINPRNVTFIAESTYSSLYTYIVVGDDRINTKESLKSLKFRIETLRDIEDV